MPDTPSNRERIEDILVDTYGEDEEASAWEATFQDEIETPFQAALFGASVEVRAFRVETSVGVQCLVVGKGRERWIGVEDLDPEGLPTDFTDLLDLYRAWRKGGY